MQACSNAASAQIQPALRRQRPGLAAQAAAGVSQFPAPPSIVYSRARCLLPAACCCPRRSCHAWQQWPRARRHQRPPRLRRQHPRSARWCCTRWQTASWQFPSTPTSATARRAAVAAGWARGRGTDGLLHVEFDPGSLSRWQGGTADAAAGWRQAEQWAGLCLTRGWAHGDGPRPLHRARQGAATGVCLGPGLMAGANAAATPLES